MRQTFCDSVFGRINGLLRTLKPLPPLVSWKDDGHGEGFAVAAFLAASPDERWQRNTDIPSAALALPLATLLGAGIFVAAVLLVLLRLLGLASAVALGALRGFDLAHVIEILNQILSAEAALVVSCLCHDKLLVTPLCPSANWMALGTSQCHANVCSWFRRIIASRYRDSTV
jgi:hypothetical protein